MDLPHDDGPAYVGFECGKMIKHSCGGKHQTVCKKTKLFRRKFSVCRFGSNTPTLQRDASWWLLLVLGRIGMKGMRSR
jgi:hypothetical protein